MMSCEVLRLPEAAALPEPSLLTPSQLAAVAKALAHPARVAILQRLAASDRERTTGEIVAETGLAQSTVSEHLRVLRQAELLKARRDGSRTWYSVHHGVIRRFACALHELAQDPEPAGT